MYRIVSIRIKEGREGGRLFVAVGRFELLVGLLSLCLLFASGSVAQQRHPPTASEESLEAIVLHGSRGAANSLCICYTYAYPVVP